MPWHHAVYARIRTLVVSLQKAVLDVTGQQMLLEDGGDRYSDGGSARDDACTTTFSGNSNSRLATAQHMNRRNSSSCRRDDNSRSGGGNKRSNSVGALEEQAPLPLLVEMATPQSRHHNSLARFKHRTAVYMDKHGVQVPHAGAALCWARAPKSALLHSKSMRTGTGTHTGTNTDAYTGINTTSTCSKQVTNTAATVGTAGGSAGYSRAKPYWCVSALHDCDPTVPPDQVALMLKLVDADAGAGAADLTAHATNQAAGFAAPDDDSIDGRAGNAGAGWVVDAEGDVEFRRGMLRGLLRLRWRRLELKYR